jgi:prepilin-type N-terminal cleavage/methylation domain-containing protein
MKVGAKQTGFTIVELLIVIVVIAILAAIGMLAYAGVRDRANDSAVRSDLSNISTKLKAYAAENGEYPTTTAQLATMGLKVSKNSYGNHMYNGTSYYNLVYCWPNSGPVNNFALVASSLSGKVFEHGPTGNGEAAYTFTGGSAGICTNAGITTGGTSRIWFFDTNQWQSSFLP